jgi:mRNA interferase MazF
MYRGEIWWANLPNPIGSEPGYRRPVLIIQVVCKLIAINESR